MSAPVIVVLAMMTAPQQAPARASAETAPKAEQSDARAAEEAAFAAVEGKRWCEAMARFLEVHGHAPNPDLVFNAAQAAEYGEDRARAMQLYTQLLGTTTSDQRKAEAKKRIAALTKLVEKSGPGTTCPSLPALSAAPAEASTTSSPAVTTTVAPPAQPAADGAFPWGIASAGAGAAGVIAGGALVGVGSSPYFDHAAVQEQLLAAEQSGTTDGVDALAARQRSAREGWETWGRTATIAGVIVASAGLVAVVGGAVMWLTDEGAAE